MTERDQRLYLSDIAAAVDRILENTAEGREAFLSSRKTQDAVVRNLEILGEAAKNVSEEIRHAHPEIPWSDMARTRDRVIHGYFNIDVGSSGRSWRKS